MSLPFKVGLRGARALGDGRLGPGGTGDEGVDAEDSGQWRESRIRLTTSYYVYVCRRGSFTNFSHGGPLDVSFLIPPGIVGLMISWYGQVGQK